MKPITDYIAYYPESKDYKTSEEFTRACRKAENTQSQLNAQFQIDVLEEVGLSKHPKKDEIYMFAHSHTNTNTNSVQKTRTLQILKQLVKLFPLHHGPATA